MQIKRYEVNSIQEALNKIKMDLGEEAVILSTKRLRGGKVPLLEVTAARDETGKKFDARKHDGNEMVERSASSEIDMMRSDLSEMKALIKDMRREDPIRKELSQLKEHLRSLMNVLGTWEKNLFPGPQSKIYYQLVVNGVSRERAYKLVNSVNRVDNFENTRASLEDTITNSIPVPGAKKKKGVIAFVGPTGVGKTTTLAKLAARYSMNEKLSIGLVSADTYRIAAADQLKTYAKIMGLPVKVVSEKGEFREAIMGFADRDLIMVDTPGKSRKDRGYMEKLCDFLNVDVPVETNLLLSLSSSRENMLEAASRFGSVNYDNIIFTKVDEATGLGSMYDVIDEIRKPVSYLTVGQNVPNDIEDANPEIIARLIMR
ncbi:MAG TPA: flagellar biosynthesis protein FlhF, partial [Syntrophales bacterium]|nr:flagellar biosynthesis protein FlhF [Syntrophales bacterium]